MIDTITDRTLSLSGVVECVSHSTAGAVVTFEGIVRNHSKDTSGKTRSIDYLEYEAYTPMARREMTRVIEEVQARWDVRCAAVHRIGKLQIGETAVAIAVSASHRDAAFEACRYAIDRIKQTVPIWKKEFASDGYWWVESPVDTPAASAVTNRTDDVSLSVS